MTEKTPPADVLQRYLAGTCTNSERALVEDWYQKLNLPGETTFTNSDQDRLLESVQLRIADEAKPAEHIRPLISAKWWRYAGGIAAMLILSFGLFYLLYQRQVTPAAVQGEK